MVTIMIRLRFDGRFSGFDRLAEVIKVTAHYTIFVLQRNVRVHVLNKR